jgi:hypothetical protein
MTDVCLHLLAAPELEEKLLDQLLLHPKIASFVSQPAASHGGHMADLDQSEQVLGRGEAVLIQALLTAEDAESLIVELRVLFAHSGVLFWLLPVLARGAL